MLTSNLKFQGNRLTILKNLGIEPNNILGIIVHLLQLLKTYEAAIALIFIYNAYRGLLYSTAAVYIKCNFPARCFGTLMG